MAYPSPIIRTYIDTRTFKLTSTDAPLPLLATLPPETQASIIRFLRASDRFMSLSSALLKHHFIHQTAKLAWSDITISRTPKPHSRPYWSPPDVWSSEWSDGDGGLEFNVSHQAGLTCLVGTRTPQRHADLTPLDPSILMTTTTTTTTTSPTQSSQQQPRLGVDIACTREPGRGPRNISKAAHLNDWIEVFAEMFSAREREQMKLPSSVASTSPLPPTLVDSTLRRFYTAWALKEAFIKLVGEGLLAPWLRELEFLHVQPPAAIAVSAVEQKMEKWTPARLAVNDFDMLFRGVKIPADEIKIDVVAFEANFVVAVATRGITETAGKVGGDPGRQWVKLDIERDIRPCAEGRCGCLA